MLSDIIKTISILCIFYNLYPLTFFAVFCLFQNTCQSIFRIGKGSIPITTRANQVEHIFQTFLAKKSLDKESNNFTLFTKSIDENYHEDGNKMLSDGQRYVLSTWCARYFKFLGHYISYSAPDTKKQIFSSLALFPNYNHNIKPEDSEVINNIAGFLSGCATKKIRHEGHFLWIYGYARNLQAYLKSYPAKKESDMPEYEWMLQISNAFRLKVRLNPITFAFLSILLLLLLMPAYPFVMPGITVSLMALLYYHTTDEYIELTLGHDIRSPGSHFIRISPVDNRLYYSLGVTTLNCLTNAILLYFCFIVGLSSVNIFQMIGVYQSAALFIVTLIDRSLTILNRNLSDKYPSTRVIVNKKYSQLCLANGEGIYIPIIEPVRIIHSYIFRLGEISIPIFNQTK